MVYVLCVFDKFSPLLSSPFAVKKAVVVVGEEVMAKEKTLSRPVRAKWQEVIQNDTIHVG